MIFVITGPTCLGKSETAVAVAKAFNAEIVNGDAFQIYKEMNIGVAKPEEKYLNEVPHHLYSIIEPNVPFSIADYQKVLRTKIDEILASNKNVVIVGGSGLYIRSALYDYEFKPQQKFDTSSYDKLSDEELFEIIKKLDPEEAKKLHPNNRKRVMRAIVICMTNDKTKTELLNEQKHELIYKDVYFFVRDMDRMQLFERIDSRVDQMIDEGLVNEVKSLYGKYGLSIQAMQAIGYKEFIDYFEGKDSLENTIGCIKKHTRKYAKRQMTYIRHQFPVIFYKDTDGLLSLIKNLK